MYYYYYSWVLVEPGPEQEPTAVTGLMLNDVVERAVCVYGACVSAFVSVYVCVTRVSD